MWGVVFSISFFRKFKKLRRYFQRTFRTLVVMFNQFMKQFKSVLIKISLLKRCKVHVISQKSELSILFLVMESH